MDLEQILAGLSIIGLLFAAFKIPTKGMRADIKALQDSDSSNKITIAKIETTLENLVHGHEKTQAMIMNITAELIKTIQDGKNKS